jgi:hypothetical protein
MGADGRRQMRLAEDPCYPGRGETARGFSVPVDLGSSSGGVSRVNDNRGGLSLAVRGFGYTHR